MGYTSPAHSLFLFSLLARNVNMGISDEAAILAHKLKTKFWEWQSNKIGVQIPEDCETNRSELPTGRLDVREINLFKPFILFIMVTAVELFS